MAKTTFAQVGDSRDNNFDFLRFLMASMVIFGHGYAFVAGGSYYGNDPLERLTNWNTGFGGFAVEGFFLISGYLVTRSWLFSKGAGDYAKKRALRILPALAVVLLFCAFVVGPLATTLPLTQYFHNSQTYKYLTLMLCHDFKTSDHLPGVFVHHPWPRSVDSSLWTIRYEMVCYVMVALIGMVQMYRKPETIMGLAVVVYALYFANGHNMIHLGELGQLFYLMTYFLVGMLFYIKRESVPYSFHYFLISIGVMVTAVSADLWLAHLHPHAETPHFLRWVMPFVSGYALFYLAFSKRIKLHHFAKYGDVSYGIYIYAFPVQQLVVHYTHNSLSPPVHFLVSMCFILPCAALSWYLVEQPFLRLKGKGKAKQAAARPAAAPVDPLPNVLPDPASTSQVHLVQETSEGA